MRDAAALVALAALSQLLAALVALATKRPQDLPLPRT